MTPQQRNATIALLATLGLGGGAIATGLISLNNGDAPDCSLKAQCQRIDEQMGAWIRCPDQACVDAVDRAVSEIADHCPSMPPNKCTPEMLK